jgi:hypothetical protein
MTPALNVHCMHLCSNIPITQNNPAPCSVGRIPEHLWGDTTKITSHRLFKVISGLVAKHSFTFLQGQQDIVATLYTVRPFYVTTTKCLYFSFTEYVCTFLSFYSLTPFIPGYKF